MVSVVDQAKRALVVLIRSLALAYKFPIDVKRESPDKDASTAYRSHKKPALDKASYRRRVREVLRTRKAQQAAKNIAKGFKKVCKLVVQEKGAHSGK